MTEEQIRAWLAQLERVRAARDTGTGPVIGPSRGEIHLEPDCAAAPDDEPVFVRGRTKKPGAQPG